MLKSEEADDLYKARSLNWLLGWLPGLLFVAEASNRSAVADG